MCSRRRFFGWTMCSAAASLLVLGAGAGCGGVPTRLVTVKSGTGEGAIQLEVKNLTDVPINSLFLAKSEEVSSQLDPDSPEGQKVWGADLLNAAIPTGKRVPVSVAGPGRWDCRALDRDGRYQHVAALKLEAGGRYILELQQGGWRVQ
ncbi:MAG TPA: hypothetical protein VJN18_30300 [Polyangiaceae bacterium]|nr:hypothetical protein [Polyangiaceae bacterium]